MTGQDDSRMPFGGNPFLDYRPSQIHDGHVQSVLHNAPEASFDCPFAIGTAGYLAITSLREEYSSLSSELRQDPRVIAAFEVRRNNVFLGSLNP